MGAVSLGEVSRGAVSPGEGAARHEPTVFAHRGASADAPENTLAAVRLARRLGARWVENDVQRTKDGGLVVIHDSTLKRTTDVEKVFPRRAPWNVGDFTLAEIERLDAGSWFDARFRGERVPTLEQYLAELDHTGQGLLLEIKEPGLYPGIEAEIAHELGRLGWLDRAHVRKRLIVQSFDVDSLATFHVFRPMVRTALLGTPDLSDVYRYAWFTDGVNPRAKDATSAYVSALHDVRGAHGKRLRVSTWTVNDVATVRRVVANGVDGLITNRPDMVLDAVRMPEAAFAR
ncbi:glycerophosphodiester phosphodiesterase [Wenjunlia tyrosinilytica]